MSNAGDLRFLRQGEDLQHSDGRPMDLQSTLPIRPGSRTTRTGEHGAIYRLCDRVALALCIPWRHLLRGMCVPYTCVPKTQPILAAPMAQYCGQSLTKAGWRPANTPETLPAQTDGYAAIEKHGLPGTPMATPNRRRTLANTWVKPRDSMEAVVGPTGLGSKLPGWCFWRSRRCHGAKPLRAGSLPRNRCEPVGPSPSVRAPAPAKMPKLQRGEGAMTCRPGQPRATCWA